MIAIPIGELQVDSDLQLEVDGVPARLIANGRQLTLSTSDAGRLVARALDSLPGGRGPLRSALAEAATLLDALGLTANVVDDSGDVLELGRGCHSVLGRLLLSSDRVQLGSTSMRVIGTVVRHSQVVQRRVALAAAGAVGGGAVAGVVVVAGLRRRSGSRS
ncbi:hypothetical protein [uncultured Jatrophihabitans sp.]|uniref:hypothetical protein n=1 Tax=uncultured Jatrophihabitans sp. TaxID=1610747 RepID=UPI0035CACA2E